MYRRVLLERSVWAKEEGFNDEGCLGYEHRVRGLIIVAHTLEGYMLNSLSHVSIETLEFVHSVQVISSSLFFVAAVVPLFTYLAPKT